MPIVIGIPPACKPVVSDLWPNGYVRVRVVVYPPGERVEATDELGKIGIPSVRGAPRGMSETFRRVYCRKDTDEECPKQTRHGLSQVLALPGFSEAANCS